MARTNLSSDLSDLFNDDDSEGHRLVEFIQNKRGGFKKQNFLFMNYEPPRMSLKVQLEKLRNSPMEACVTGNENQEEYDGNETEKKNTNEKILMPTPTVKVGSVDPIRLTSPCEPMISLSTENPHQPINASPPKYPVSSNILNLRPKSPGFAAIRKSGGVSPSDRLRRYSLKRLTKLCSGRRTLLQEFENTSDNFDPTVFSTPVSQVESDKPPISNITKQSDNIEQNSTEKNVTSKSCCSHTDSLIKSLQRKDKALRNYMSNVDTTLKNIQCTQIESNKSKMDNTQTKSSSDSNYLKRTYTVEKENFHGKTLLTRNSIVKNIDNELLNAPHNSPSHTTIGSQNFGLPKCHNQAEFCRRSKMVQICMLRESQQEDTSLLNKINLGPEVSKSQTNMSIMLCTQEVKIPETQDQPDVIIHSDGETPMVVIPIAQPVNGTCEQELTHKKIVSITEQGKINSTTSIVQPTGEAKCSQLTDDSLKLSDIFTDDEDVTTNSLAMKNNSQAPLNLAPSATNLLRKHFQNHGRMLKIDNSHLSINCETEEVPPAHCKSRMTGKKYKPLNKAPGIPLNGEKFAHELARMSSYEILDLRKRNSMGQIFAISGRTTRNAHQSAIKKKQQLDNEIKKEIGRRKNLNVAANRKLQYNPDDVVCERNLNAPLPVPHQIRDSLTTQGEPLNNLLMMPPLIDEKSSDHISTKLNENKIKSRKLKKKPVTEELQHYLEVSQRLPLNKSEKSNNLKRSLFSQEQYEMEVNNNITDNLNIPCLPPPPNSEVGLDINVDVSPPPALNVTLQASIEKKTEHIGSEVVVLEEVPQPPSTNLIISCTVLTTAQTPTCERDSDMITNTSNRSSTSSPIRLVQSNSQTTTNDDKLFKIPAKPAPKRKAGRQKRDKIISIGLLESTTASWQSNDTTDSTGSLRRSKRKHVPSNYSVTLFEELYSRLMNKQRKKFEKKMEQEKDKRKEIAKINRQNKTKNDTDTVKSYKSPISTKPTKGFKKKKQLAVILENNDYISNTLQNTEISNKRKKQGSTVAENQNVSNEIMDINKNFESGHLILTDSSPVDHLNNIYDELKNAVSTPSISLRNVRSTLKTSLEVRPKVKPFKVRIARLKPPVQSNGRCDSVCSATSSTTRKNSNYELVTWLKSIRESDFSMTIHEYNISKEMKCSPASNLCFTELQGVEYAFYDADEKACLGYLRFKPRQIKPMKRAKRFELNFIILVGKFRIAVNNQEKLSVVGDLVVISKSAYYEIENLSDDIAILMVVKKE